MPFGEQPPGRIHRRAGRSSRSRSAVPAFVQALGISGFLVGGIVYLGHDVMNVQALGTDMAEVDTAETASAVSSPVTDETCQTWSIAGITVSVPDTKDGRTTWDHGADAHPDLRLALAVGTAPAVESDTFRDSLQTTWRLTSSVQASAGTPVVLFADDIDGAHAERITGWHTTLPSSRAASSWDVGAARFELRCES